MVTTTILIRGMSAVLAIVSLVMLWKVPQYVILWWVILALFIFGRLSGQTVRNSIKVGYEAYIVAFWAKVNMVFTLACYIVPIAGIVLSFYTAPVSLLPVDQEIVTPLAHVNSPFAISESIAYDLGMVYQMGRNCNKDLDNVSPDVVVALFDTTELPLIFYHYMNGMNSQKGKACDNEELDTVLLVLNENVSNYLKRAKRDIPEKMEVSDEETVTLQLKAGDPYAVEKMIVYDLGRVYQMGSNCNQELDSVSPNLTLGLVLNYFDTQDIPLMIDYYERGMNSQKGKLCDQDELNILLLKLKELGRIVIGAGPGPVR